MKILMVTNQYPNSTLTTTNPAVFYQVQDLRKLGVDVDIFYVNRVKTKVLAYLLMFFPLRHKWKNGSYDLMHIQFGGLQALIGALIAKKRAIISFHGTDLHGGTPINFSQNLSRKFVTWCSRVGSRIAGGIIVVSQNLIDYLPTKVQNKAVIVPTGVDYELFVPLNRDEARKKLNLDPGLKYILFSDISGSTVKRRDIAQAVEKKVQSVCPEAKLLLMNQQPYAMVPYYLNASYCLLLTSDKEGSPNIIKEALAVNLPIVSVDVGDVEFRCTNVENCQIVPRDVDELAVAVLKAFSLDRAQGGRIIKQPDIDNRIIAKKILSQYSILINQ